jgi:hypothetical protein
MGVISHAGDLRRRAPSRPRVEQRDPHRARRILEGSSERPGIAARVSLGRCPRSPRLVLDRAFLPATQEWIPILFGFVCAVGFLTLLLT